MKKLFTILFYLTFVALAIYTAYLYNVNVQHARNFSRLQTEYQNLKIYDSTYIRSLQKQLQSELSKNVQELQKKELEVPPSVRDMGIVITTTETQASLNEKNITFWIKGDNSAIFDAVDLGLVYSNIKGIPECKTQDVFTQYPLLQKTSTTLIVTGISGISSDKITTGAINKALITCTFTKNNPSEKARIELNPIKTHVYALGESVFNLKDSFASVEW